MRKARPDSGSGKGEGECAYSLRGGDEGSVNSAFSGGDAGAETRVCGGEAGLFDGGHDL